MTSENSSSDVLLAPGGSPQEPVSTLRPFRHAAFAVMWCATAISSIGTGMYMAASGWLMQLELTDIWSLKFAAAGQWSSTAMLASQEFYLGGAAFGRGYSAAEFSGDNGLAASLELRFDQKLSSDVFKGYQLYGFVDRGAQCGISDPMAKTV